MAEFAIVLPVLLALVGVTIDFARVYQAWLNLESATRDAAQYLATSAADPLDPNHSANNRDGKAKYILETATGATFNISSSQTSCSDPMVGTSYSESTSAASGGSTTNPIGTAQVTTCFPFRTLFSYPVLTVDGNWVLRSDRTYTVVVGR